MPQLFEENAAVAVQMPSRQCTGCFIGCSCWDTQQHMVPLPVAANAALKEPGIQPETRDHAVQTTGTTTHLTCVCIQDGIHTEPVYTVY